MTNEYEIIDEGEDVSEEEDEEEEDLISGTPQRTMEVTIDDLPKKTGSPTSPTNNKSNKKKTNRKVKRKSKKSSKNFKPKPGQRIPTAVLMYYYDDITWELEGRERIPKLLINGVSVLITGDQVIELKKKEKKRQAKTRKLATQKANGMQKIGVAAFIKEGKPISANDIIENQTKMVHKLMKGVIVRYRVRKMRIAATLIQRWYRDMLPLRNTFRAYYSKLQQARKIEVTKKTKSLKKAKSQLELTKMVQRHVLMYKDFLNTQYKLQERAALPVQNYVRMHKAFFHQQVVQAAATLVQSNVRMHLVKLKDDMSLEMQIQALKLSILKYYEVLCAPYTRRALFIYNTRIVSRATYHICIEELRYLKNRDERFMNRKQFRKHMTYILKQLQGHSRDPQLQSIVRSVFQPEIVYRDALGNAYHANSTKGQRVEKSSWLARFRRKKKKPEKEPFENVVENIQKENEHAIIIENPTNLDGEQVNDPDELPFGYILKEMVRIMYSSESTIQRANYATVIMFNFVMTSLIQNPSAAKKKIGSYRAALKQVSQPSES